MSPALLIPIEFAPGPTEFACVFGATDEIGQGIIGVLRAARDGSASRSDQLESKLPKC
jgi:hypothetical protein